jgi:hypothetical protein
MVQPSLLRLLLAALFATGLMTSASAQSPGTGNVGPNRVTFYTEPGYQGEALVVEAGAAVENLERLTRQGRQSWAGAISSVRIDGAAQAHLFSEPGFSGDAIILATSIPDLYAESRGRTSGPNWDRAIAAVRVTGPATIASAPPPPPVMERPPTTVFVTPPPPPPPAVVVVTPARPRLDPRTADLIVQRAYREVLDRGPDPEGARLYRQRLMQEGWSERQVIEHLQRSSEARAVNADAAIAKAYREVLGREPDANGLAHYRAKWREGWTQGQIRADLQRSKESRTVNVQAVITRVYREVLGRDPDPAGYATYERLMRERGYTERDIRSALMNSDEYRQRRGRK